MGNNSGDETLFEVADDDEPAVVKVPAGRSKVFCQYDPSQSFLVPASLDDRLPEDHTARFISEVVDELLDLSVIYDSYVEASGAPLYDPTMMLKLLFYAYSTGVTSSREMERRCHVDVAFRWLTGNTAPDYRSIGRFRRRHLVALDDLFTQVLVLCWEAGLVKLGRVALDGTKLRASTSRHKAMSYGRLGPRIEQLEAEVAGILADAEATDLAEVAEFGEDRCGDDTVVAEAAATAATRATPRKQAQRSFTDPETRMMKTVDGFHYAYNAQAVVDECSQVIVATDVTQQAGDVGQLIPMIGAVTTSLANAGVDDDPKIVLADAEYCSEDNLQQLSDTKVNAVVATGKIRHNERVPDAPTGRIPKDATQRERMARRMRTKAGRADYARRKAIVEPVFGQTKTRQHAKPLRLRGFTGAKGEWTLHAICHNLRKLANATEMAPLPSY